MRIESNPVKVPAGNVNANTAGAVRVGNGFGKALEQVQQPLASPNDAHVRVIKAGDTLTGIVREQAQLQGVKLTPTEEFRWSQALATDSGIQNPNAIFPGQKIQLQKMVSAWQSGQTLAQNKSATVETIVVTAARSAPAPVPSRFVNAAAHPVLSQTLDRAVDRGFIPKVEKTDVYNKILQVAQKHNFAPDDFARLTLMESDGMNPQATNTRCHGIIQFCDGPARGAAEVGFEKSPKSILGLSVYQQLHLVDTYFDKVGLKKEGRVPLDELYLAVLQPAARAEKRPEEPLGIPGKQAKYLYEGKDPQAPMTRVSITQGLVQNAADRLGLKSFKSSQNSQSFQNTLNAKSPLLSNTQQLADAGQVKSNSSVNINLTTNSDANASRIRQQVQRAADFENIDEPRVWLR
jgi:hypothetical protein